MASQVMADVAATKVTDDAVISRLRLNGAWLDALRELQHEARLFQVAKKEGLSVTDSELQQDFDAYRLANGLERAEDTHQWLNSAGLSVEVVESFLEAGLIGNKLAQKIITDSAVDAYYKQNPREFEYAQISHLVVKDAGAANELALSAREEDENFAELARKHSIDKSTSAGGGFVGLLTRQLTKGMPTEVADRIFSAKPGDIVGPFQYGKNYCVVNVLEVGRRPLDDGLKTVIRAKLFNQWLSAKTA